MKWKNELRYFAYIFKKFKYWFALSFILEISILFLLTLYSAQSIESEAHPTVLSLLFSNFSLLDGSLNGLAFLFSSLLPFLFFFFSLLRLIKQQLFILLMKQRRRIALITHSVLIICSIFFSLLVLSGSLLSAHIILTGLDQKPIPREFITYFLLFLLKFCTFLFCGQLSYLLTFFIRRNEFIFAFLALLFLVILYEFPRLSSCLFLLEKEVAIPNILLKKIAFLFSICLLLIASNLFLNQKNLSILEE